MKEVFEGKKRLLIVMQDNPDPDTIASAIAFKKIAKFLGEIKCSIAHGGTVGRGENRAVVQYLNLKMHQCCDIIYGKYDIIGMVDIQPCTGNNSLPKEIVPEIIFDHHPIIGPNQFRASHDTALPPRPPVQMKPPHHVYAPVPIDPGPRSPADILPALIDSHPNDSGTSRAAM